METWHDLYKLSFLLLLCFLQMYVWKNLQKWFSNNTMIDFKANFLVPVYVWLQQKLSH